MHARHGGKVLSLTALLGVMGISVTGLLNAWFRFTGISELLQSYWVLAYVAISFLFGMAVTYYFDNTGDRKLNIILKAFLRLLGASLVVIAFQQLWEAALIVVMCMCALLLATGGSTEQEQAQLVPVTPTAGVACIGVTTV